jgi:hypothetical protein
MAGSDEQLRMIATLTDQWSPQLKQIRRSLRSLAGGDRRGDPRAALTVRSRAVNFYFVSCRSRLWFERLVRRLISRPEQELSPATASSCNPASDCRQDLGSFPARKRHLDGLAVNN